MSGIFLAMASTGAVLLLGALSNRISSRLNMPILFAFLGVGMLLTHFSRYSVSAQYINSLGTVAMAFILFAGGMDTRFNSVKRVFRDGAILATAGVILTALILGVCAYWIFKIPYVAGDYRLNWCLLLGAVISSTDAASVFGILRGRGVALEGNLKELLEFESGSNDPMAYCLTKVMLLVFAGGEFGLGSSIALSIISLAGGAAFGMACGWLGKQLFKIKLEYEGLYFVFIVGLVFLAYGCAELLHVNGMMACYVAGIMLSHLKFNYQRSMTRFSDGVSWLMQVILFVTLGASVDQEKLLDPAVLVPGILLSLVLMCVARPIAVWLCSIGSGRSWKDNCLISWVGLRGAAPIVLATFPLAAHVPYCDMMFSMIFFMVLISILLQGATLMPVARLLGKAKIVADRSRLPLELEVTRATSGSDMFEFIVPEKADYAGKTLAEIRFPADALVTMVRRGEELLSPHGSTQLYPGDGVLIMAPREVMATLAQEYFPDSDYESDDRSQSDWHFPSLHHNQKVKK
ncbi:MAG: potassium/proton antiporter [Victivallaceae bacterium]|nr:potassium/proton antiporter [Victivallaceae bacterium]